LLIDAHKGKVTLVLTEAGSPENGQLPGPVQIGNVCLSRSEEALEIVD